MSCQAMPCRIRLCRERFGPGFVKTRWFPVAVTGDSLALLKESQAVRPWMTRKCDNSLPKS